MKSPPVIEDRTDRKRGCGWRKPGGLYLVADGTAQVCGKLPLPLDVCPCCGGGIRPSRGWTWVNGAALAASRPCDAESRIANCESRIGHQHDQADDSRLAIRDSQLCSCPLGGGGPILAGGFGRCGLLWVGGSFYPTPKAFIDESIRQGVSRRIAAVPNGLVIGRTWVMLAHRRAVANPDGSFSPAVFTVFRPRAIEYLVRDEPPADPPELLARLAARGITLVRVSRVGEPLPLLDGQDDAGTRGRGDAEKEARTPLAPGQVPSEGKET